MKDYNFEKLKGHGHGFSQILFLYIYCLQFISNAFLMINQNLRVSFGVISKTQSSKFFVM